MTMMMLYQICGRPFENDQAGYINDQQGDIAGSWQRVNVQRAGVDGGECEKDDQQTVMAGGSVDLPQ